MTASSRAWSPGGLINPQLVLVGVNEHGKKWAPFTLLTDENLSNSRKFKEYSEDLLKRFIKRGYNPRDIKENIHKINDFKIGDLFI